MSRRTETGFTLLEIVVALAIAAVGIAAVAKYTASAAEVSYQTEERMLAVWVAGNRLSELRVGRFWPAPGSYQHYTTMGQRTWYMSETISETSLRDLRRVEVEVYTDPERTRREFGLSGYLARYVPAEQPPADESPEPPDDGGDGEATGQDGQDGSNESSEGAQTPRDGDEAGGGSG